MDPVSAVVLGAMGAAVVSVVVWFERREGEARAANWRECAKRLALRVDSDERMTGSRGPLLLSVEIRQEHAEVGGAPAQPEAGSDIRTVFTVEHGSIPRSLELSKKSAGTKILRAMGARDVEIGDAAFDAAVQIGGDAAELMAVLDENARTILAAGQAELEIEVKRGVVEGRADGRHTNPARVVPLAERVVAIAQALSLGDRSIPDRIAGNARQEVNPEVRRRMLRVILDRFPGTESERAAIEMALAGEDVELAIEASVRVGGEAATTRLSRAVLDAAVAPHLRVDALERLIEIAGFERAGRIVERLVDDPDVFVASAAIRAAGVHGAGEMIDRLLHLLEPSRAPPPLLVSIAGALESLGAAAEPRVEEALLALLRHANPSVQVAAARALGPAASILAVEPLLAAAKGILIDGAVKAAVREAVRAIQSRAGGAEAGALSLSDGGESSGGRLSLDQRPSGSLSKVESTED